MKRAILTIDDISSANTPALVDYLLGKNIKAVLFAVGENVERHYEEALYALRAGMIVGNHSYSHPHFSDLSPEEAAEEIGKNEAVLDQLYKDAGVARSFRPFRFPYGDNGGKNAEAIQEYLKARGFHKLKDSGITDPWWKEMGLDKRIDTFWTYDYEEYRVRPGSGFTAEDVMKKIRNPISPAGTPALTEAGVNLLLLHAHDETEALFPKYYEPMIGALLEQGFVFVTPEFFTGTP